MKKLLCLALAATVLSGCYTIRYTTHARPEGAVRDEQWQHAFLNGLIVASPPTNVSAICPDGVAVVENEITVLNGLLSGVVQGAVGGAITSQTGAVLDPAYGPYGGPAFSLNVQLWTPSTVRVTCAAAQSRQREAPGSPP